MPSPATDPKATGSTGPAALAAGLDAELAGIDAELAEIDLLVTQATTEAGRHEAKRVAAAEKFELARGFASTPSAELAELATTLATLTKRATLMESQVDVLQGKRRTLVRFRDSLAGHADALRELDAAAGPTSAWDVGAGRPDEAGALGPDGLGPGALDPNAPLPPGISRLVLGAQEELRRDIARAIHDGPAQSLTNIVLQAQIVDRLLARDPEAARGEVRQLVAMVQATLDATKSFIFDVRPMVLDDLGLVPTLRGAARDRERRTGIPVDFDSVGADHRLARELESGLFRMIEEALSGFLAGGPQRVAIRLEWSAGHVGAQVRSVRDVPAAEAETRPAPARPSRRSGRADEPAEEMPVALAAMLEDRRADQARRSAPIALPAKVWREIQQRAATLGIAATLGADGSELRLALDPAAVP